MNLIKPLDLTTNIRNSRDRETFLKIPQWCNPSMTGKILKDRDIHFFNKFSRKEIKTLCGKKPRRHINKLSCIEFIWILTEEIYWEILRWSKEHKYYQLDISQLLIVYCFWQSYYDYVFKICNIFYSLIF